MSLHIDEFSFLNDFMVANPIFFDPFDNVKIGLSNSLFRIVRKEQLKGSQAIELLSEVTFVPAETKVVIQNLKGLDASCIFSIPNHLTSELKLYFEDADYVNAFATYLDWLAKQEEWRNNGKAIQVDFSGNYLWLSAWENEHLIRYESWPAQQTIDVIYFLNKFLDTLNLKIDESTYLFTGTRYTEIQSEVYLNDLILKKGIQFSRPKWTPESHFLLPLYAISE